MKKTGDLSLEKHQKCNICYNFYSNQIIPMVINCGHTYCSDCIEKI